MKQPQKTRILVISDFHCGHLTGLTPPDWQWQNESETAWRKEICRYQKWAWNEYVSYLDEFRPYDRLLVLGDCVDGKGERIGGREQLTTDRDEQAEMAVACIQETKVKTISMVRGCFVAGHKVLTADLRYVPVEQLKAGDKLLSVEEFPQEGRMRQWVVGEVLANEPIQKPVYDIYLSDSTKLTVTEDHPFLINSKWHTAKQLYKSSHYYGKESKYKDRQGRMGLRNNNPPIKFSRVLPVWETKTDYSAGYLAGFFDGEGSCSQRLKKPRRGWPERIFTINGYQNDNAMLNTALRYLSQHEILYSTYKHDGHNNTNIQIRGGIAEKLRFLGMIRPPRLLDKFNPEILGSYQSWFKDNTTILGIVPAGTQTVYGLGTTCKTYIAEGFISHNTQYHVGVDEDWENAVARNVKAKIGNHLYITVNGVTISAKHFIGGSQVPQSKATSIMREQITNDQWVREYEKHPKASIFLRAHVHRAIVVDEPKTLSCIVPGLQGWTDFGSRKCSMPVHFGIMVIDIDKKGNWSWYRKTAELGQQVQVIKW